MKDFTNEEWKFLDWIEEQIHLASIGEDSFLEKQFFNIEYTHAVNYPLFSTSDILCIEIMEFMSDYGVAKTITEYNITIPTNHDFLLKFLLEMPIEYIICMINNSIK